MFISKICLFAGSVFSPENQVVYVQWCQMRPMLLCSRHHLHLNLCSRHHLHFCMKFIKVGPIVLCRQTGSDNNSCFYLSRTGTTMRKLCSHTAPANPATTLFLTSCHRWVKYIETEMMLAKRLCVKKVEFALAKEKFNEIKRISIPAFHVSKTNQMYREF